ncbi:hypothetical protein ACFLXI_00320 [Chloroflexota bacterium]
MDTKAAIQSQFLATLEILKKAVEMCPDEMWADTEPKNKFWHIAFHSLFYTHFYLHPTEGDFVAWEKHQDEVVSLKPSFDPDLVQPYSQAEILEYLTYCQGQVREKVAAADLDAESGFSWLPFNTLEKHLYNIRHTQLHAGELCERLGQAGIDVDWVGMVRD